MKLHSLLQQSIHSMKIVQNVVGPRLPRPLLGRPAAETESGLGASLVDPEKLGSTDDHQLAAILRVNLQDGVTASQYQEAVHVEAERLIQGFHGGTTSASGSEASMIVPQPQGDIEAAENAPESRLAW